MYTPDQPKIDLTARTLMAWSVILAVTLALLFIGRDFLIPLVVAILLWSLLNAFRKYFERLNIGGSHIPGWLATIFAVLVLLLANYGVYVMLVSQADALQAAAPIYQENFAQLTDRVAQWLGIQQMPATSQLLDRLDLGSLLSWFGGSVGAVITDLILVAIYVGFLLAEQRNIPGKLSHLLPDESRAERTRALAIDISQQVQRYVWMKTAVSILTGVVSYGILLLVGVDFAAIWALMIFFLNFIPNIGSVLGVVFPALLALVQFDSVTPFIFVVLGLGGTQFFIGNVIEPAYMGKSLNLSSFMILLSLTFWGSIWGIPGMFLSVPIMVALAIICSHFTSLQWLAVILSADGRLMKASTGS